MVKMVKRMQRRTRDMDNGHGKEILGHTNSLVEKESPDDFSDEGRVTTNNSTPTSAPWSTDEEDQATSATTLDTSDSTSKSGDDAYVTVDNPDDFE